MKEFQRRISDDDTFAQLVQFGRLASKAWWMKAARKAVAAGTNGGFGYWFAVMKNQHGWSDKAEVTDGKPVSQKTRDELLQKYAELSKQISKVPDRLQIEGILGDAIN